MDQDLSSDELQDIHICGVCKQSFGDIDAFVSHKKVCKHNKTNKSPNNESNKKGPEKLVTKAKSLSKRKKSVAKCSPKAGTNSKESEINLNECQELGPLGADPLSSIETITAVDAEQLQIDSNLMQTAITKTGSKMVYSTVLVGNDKRYKCGFGSPCGYTSYYMKDLERHFRIHTGEKPYKCDNCDRTFNRSDKLKLHLRSHTGEKPYQCDQCPYASSDRSSLVKHQRIHTDERPYKCQLCRYASRNSSQLVVHLRTHTGDAPFKCVLCSAAFKINSDLKRHMKIHTGEKPYACDLCSYRSAMKGNLQVHKKLNHSDESQIVCSECQFIATSKKALKEHSRDHNTKSLSCEHCNYTTSSRSALNNHIRTHTNEKPFVCVVCGYATRQACNLGTHMKKQHSMTDTEVTPKPKLKSRNHIHLRSGQKMSKSRSYCQTLFPCHLCDCSFVREDSLRSHLRHHQELIPTTGAALAILQLQHECQSSEHIVDNDKQDDSDIMDEQTQPQEMVLEMDSNAKTSDQTIAVDSQLYQTLMKDKDNSEANSEHSYNRSIPIKTSSKRGRPQKKAETLEAGLLSKPLELVPTPTASGQVVYHLPQSMRFVSYVPIGNTANVDTVYVINNDTIDDDNNTITTNAINT